MHGFCRDYCVFYVSLLNIEGSLGLVQLCAVFHSFGHNVDIKI